MPNAPEPMSRYFSIPGLLVDVSEVIAVACDEKTGYWFVACRSGHSIRDLGAADGKSIQEYVLEYEASVKAVRQYWLNQYREPTDDKASAT